MGKITKVLLSSALLFSPVLLSSQVEASTESTVNEKSSINILVPTAPSEFVPGDIQVYGENPPSSSASVHDISVSAYNYQVQKVGAQVYTDKFIKGKTSMKVTVQNFKRVKDVTAVKDQLTISLYNSSGKLIDSKVLSVDTSNSVSFSGLSSTTKYYVKFSVPTNGNTYSFDGSIQ